MVEGKGEMPPLACPAVDLNSSSANFCYFSDRVIRIASRFQANSVGASLVWGGWGGGDHFPQGYGQWLHVKGSSWGHLRSRLCGPMLRGHPIPLSMHGCGVLNASSEEGEGNIALLLGWLPRGLAISDSLSMFSCTECPCPCLPSGQPPPPPNR